MKIEWDPKKAGSNFRKHQVSFEEAARALRDPIGATGADPDHSGANRDILLLVFLNVVACW